MGVVVGDKLRRCLRRHRSARGGGDASAEATESSLAASSLPKQCFNPDWSSRKADEREKQEAMLHFVAEQVGQLAATLLALLGDGRDCQLAAREANERESQPPLPQAFSRGLEGRIEGLLWQNQAQFIRVVAIPVCPKSQSSKGRLHSSSSTSEIDRVERERELSGKRHEQEERGRPKDERQRARATNALSSNRP
ncbi:hypothetical protein BJ508DRAFT_300275 [Ascobolus immersus RN42]|uniref:Uncharacterized protein n=1 Tax=Ascobolus immersus RN42 TaxID=1160509 RepID=A0A3N4IP05_ASCIM|nr:hypothetical protein BJ508DRAFT_300275 [Ascobolus immersus RN42]